MNTQMVPHDTSGPCLGNILSYLVTNASQEPGFEHVAFTSHPASESGSSFWMIMSPIPPFSSGVLPLDRYAKQTTNWKRHPKKFTPPYKYGITN